MVMIKDLGVKDLGGYRKRMCIAQCKQCGDTSEKQYIQVAGKEEVLCKSCAVSNRHKARDDYNMSKTRLYSIYKNMHTRCYNENYNKNAYYLSKGITICDEWSSDFMEFREWAIASGYDDTLTIDRIDNDGNYEPSNCRWVDNFTQSQNRSKLRKDNKTGFTNVKENDSGTFSVSIQVNKQRFNLGVFNTASEGAAAYNKFVIDNRLSHQLNEGV